MTSWEWEQNARNVLTRTHWNINFENVEMPGPSYYYIENNIIDDIKLFVRYSIVPYHTKIKLIKKIIDDYRKKSLYTRVTWNEYNTSFKNILRSQISHEFKLEARKIYLKNYFIKPRLIRFVKKWVEKYYAPPSENNPLGGKGYQKSLKSFSKNL